MSCQLLVHHGTGRPFLSQELHPRMAFPSGPAQRPAEVEVGISRRKEAGMPREVDRSPFSAKAHLDELPSEEMEAATEKPRRQ